jgi:hypothetical protein
MPNRCPSLGGEFIHLAANAQRVHNKLLLLKRMRHVKQIPHPRLAVNIFAFNNKYILQIGIDEYEQTFKVPADEVGPDKLEAICSGDFFQGCMRRFLEMRSDFRNELTKLSEV